MWLYYLLKTMSTVISWLPYKAVVVIGKGMGHLYHKIAKKQRVRAEETIRERLGYSQEQAEATIKSLFVKLGITFMEIMPTKSRSRPSKCRRPICKASAGCAICAKPPPFPKSWRWH